MDAAGSFAIYAESRIASRYLVACLCACMCVRYIVTLRFRRPVLLSEMFLPLCAGCRIAHATTSFSQSGVPYSKQRSLSQLTMQLPANEITSLSRPKDSPSCSRHRRQRGTTSLPSPQRQEPPGSTFRKSCSWASPTL